MLKAPFFIIFFLVSMGLSAQVSMVIGDGGFLFKEKNDSICFYQRTPKSLNGKYSRNNYIHPLYGLDGSILTEDFPEDHLHHRGIFWSWHQIIINGKKISDPWILENFSQNVKNLQFEQLPGGNATFDTEVFWFSPLFKKGEKAYIKEEAHILFHKKEKDIRQIDFEIHINALVEHLSFGGSDDAKGYGGFSVRLHLPENVQFACNEQIITPQTTAIKAGNYVDISGSMGANETFHGVAILCHEKNPGYPQAWILSKEKSMQNIVYTGSTPVKINIGEPLILKYSIIIHDKKISKKIIQKAIKKL